MAAFIVAGLIAVATLAASFVMLFAAGMSDSPSASESVPVKSTFFTGMFLASIVVASHWLPHIGW
jgi:hypothetical protein